MKEIAEMEARRTRMLGASWTFLCPPLYSNTDLNRLPVSFQDAICSRKSQIFMGPSGVGKTRAAWLILERAHFRDEAVSAIDANEFTREVGAKFGSSPEAAHRWISKLITADVLLIDDLGKGKLTQRVESEFFDVLEGRLKRMLPTIITTNLDGEGLHSFFSAEYSDPVYRRIKEFFEVVTV